MHKFRALFACIISVWFTSCITEPKQIPVVPIVNTTNRVGILCEGNYMWGNARFDVYSVDSNKLYANVFESENKKPIGDVLQSGYFDGKSIWLTVNNSGKILKLNPSSYKQVNSRGSLRSPRYLLPGIFSAPIFRQMQFLFSILRPSKPLKKLGFIQNKPHPDMVGRNK